MQLYDCPFMYKSLYILTITVRKADQQNALGKSTQLNMFVYCQASQLGKHWTLHQRIPCQCSDALRQLKPLFDSLLVSFTFILRSHPFKFSSSSPVRQQCAGIGFHEGCGSQSGSTASS